jgi:hypothetical protein|nr:MAG TPA: hypothetical protein [Caudoviricetes sp.]
MHYDDLVYGYQWDEEPKAVTSLSEKRYLFEKIDHATQGAYKFRDSHGLFWVPKYAVAGMVHSNEDHPGYVIIDPYVEFSACYWNDREKQTTGERVPEMGKGYRKYEITPPENIQPIVKVKVLSLHSHNEELFAVCEDGKVRGFDFDDNEWYDLPAVTK